MKIQPNKKKIIKIDIDNKQNKKSIDLLNKFMVDNNINDKYIFLFYYEKKTEKFYISKNKYFYYMLKNKDIEPNFYTLSKYIKLPKKNKQFKACSGILNNDNKETTRKQKKYLCENFQNLITVNNHLKPINTKILKQNIINKRVVLHKIDLFKFWNSPNIKILCDTHIKSDSLNLFVNKKAWKLSQQKPKDKAHIKGLFGKIYPNNKNTNKTTERLLKRHNDAHKRYSEIVLRLIALRNVTRNQYIDHSRTYTDNMTKVKPIVLNDNDKRETQQILNKMYPVTERLLSIITQY